MGIYLERAYGYSLEPEVPSQASGWQRERLTSNFAVRWGNAMAARDLTNET